MGFKDYKIRDGVHIPSDKFRENWNAIFGKKKKKKEKDPHLELFEDAPKPDTPCLLYTSPSPRDRSVSRMPSSA